MKPATLSAQEFFMHQPVPAAPIPRASVRSEAPRIAHEPQESPAVHLTPRQREVLSLLCEGLPNKLICRQLNIAAGTVKVHIGVILRELGVKSRLQAVVAANRCGLLGEVTVDTPERAGDSAAVSQSTIAASRSARDASHSVAAALTGA